VSAWVRHHWLSFSQTVARLAANPLASALNVLVIGVALALPLGGYVLLANLQTFSREITTEPQISVFLAAGADNNDAADIEKRLRANPGVRNVQFVGKDKALADLKRIPGIADVVATLRENPLPDAFVATLASGDPALAEPLEKAFRLLPKVTHVQADSAWVRRVESVVGFGRTLVTLLAGLLGFALVAVTFNTIRLQILTHRDEIEISRLIGATDAFIRRPFYYLGALQGALGGVAALAVVQAGIFLLNRKLSGLSVLFGSELTMRYVDLVDGATVLAFGVALGSTGAYLSVSRHLHENDCG
jgi:cell division transport system permease protein